MSDGVPSTDEPGWVSLALGTIEHAGYHIVSVGWDDVLPAGKGAIVLRVTGARSIGTEGYLTDVRGKPLFAVARESTQGKGYMLQDDAFVEVAIQRGPRTGQADRGAADTMHSRVHGAVGWGAAGAG